MTILVLSDSGSYIGKQKEQFKISFGMSDKPISYVPAVKVSGILVDAKVSISSGAFELLKKYGIPVIWQDYFDDGMILQPFNSHGSVEVRRSQYRALDSPKGVIIAAKIVYAACKNRLTIIRRLIKYHEEFSSYQPAIDFISDKIEELISEPTEYSGLDLDLRQFLMNTEAQVTKQYYSAITSLLDEHGWSFETRTRRPAIDPFNALLNYSYAVLSGRLTHYLAISGLDIYAGFLHTDRSGRQSLVLDIIEEFRQVVVDEPLLKLVITGALTENQFDTEEGSVKITKEVKEVLFPALFARLNTRMQNMTLKNWLIDQGTQLASFLRGHTSDYHPFVLKVEDPWS